MVSKRAVLSAAVALLLSFVSSVGAQTTGTLVGAVKDAQGAMLPGANVTLISETRETSLEAQTTGTGDFEFTNM